MCKYILLMYGPWNENGSEHPIGQTVVWKLRRAEEDLEFISAGRDAIQSLETESPLVRDSFVRHPCRSARGRLYIDLEYFWMANLDVCIPMI